MANRISLQSWQSLLSSVYFLIFIPRAVRAKDYFIWVFKLTSLFYFNIYSYPMWDTRIGSPFPIHAKWSLVFWSFATSLQRLRTALSLIYINNNSAVNCCLYMGLICIISVSCRGNLQFIKVHYTFKLRNILSLCNVLYLHYLSIYTYFLGYLSISIAIFPCHFNITWHAVWQISSYNFLLAFL